MWFYTAPDGYVYRTDAFNSKNVSTKLSNYASPDELVAVIKNKLFRSLSVAGNSIKLVSARDLPIMCSAAFQNRAGKRSKYLYFSNILKSNCYLPKKTSYYFFYIIPKTELTVIQKFVKSNGPKAFVCRTCWRKGRNAYAWIITNRSDFYAEDRTPDTQKYIV
jgi:LMBR1 domain-containing protein 1